MYGTTTLPTEEIDRMESFQTKLCATWVPWIYETIKKSNLVDMAKYEGIAQKCSDEDMPYLVIEYAYEKGLEPDEEQIVASFMSGNNLTYVLANVFPEYFLFNPLVSYKADPLAKLKAGITKKKAIITSLVVSSIAGVVIYLVGKK